VNPYWPLFDLRLTVGDVELRPTAEADLDALAAITPDDLELDPSRPAYPGLPEQVGRRSWTVQSHWRSLGTWRPESWNLNLTVRYEGRPVGVQCLEGDEFARRRTVDSSSWLVADVRGRGIGTAMRLAVLALAFDGLGAEMAVTEAWHDNHASLGVSRSLGYADNGFYRHDRQPDGVDEMRRMVLTRERFARVHPAHGVRIENLPPCLPFFGLTTP